MVEKESDKRTAANGEAASDITSEFKTASSEAIVRLKRWKLGRYKQKMRIGHTRLSQRLQYANIHANIFSMISRI